MSTIKRVAITGMGTICGLGHSLDETWDALIQGRSGISNIEGIPCEDLPVKIAGEVKNFTIDPEILSEKSATRNDKFIHYALHATVEALKQANLDKTTYPATKIGTILGVAMGGFPLIENTIKEYTEKNNKRVSPFFIPSVIPNMASGLISITQGFEGVNLTVASACASSSHAITAAAQEIMLGKQDAVVTGGTEAILCPAAILGFDRMKALSRNNDNPKEASRPFDKDRNGFVIGEGAGILILENLEKAKARGATIFAEIIGHGASSDAAHITAPHPEGKGAIACMKQAIANANISPEDISYINAHGTSTGLGDMAETTAIKTVFAENAKNINISSTKSMTGHLLGAAGGLETIFCTKAIYEGVIPPTINLDNQDPNCDLNYTANKAIKKDIEYAMNNSFGFGGTNSCLILKKYKG